MDNREYFLKKLVFRATHRGTREMDIYLGGFIKNYINQLTDEELNEFKQILRFSDKQLSDWLIYNKKNQKIEAINISNKLKKYKFK